MVHIAINAHISNMRKGDGLPVTWPYRPTSKAIVLRRGKGVVQDRIFIRETHLTADRNRQHPRTNCLRACPITWVCDAVQRGAGFSPEINDCILRSSARRGLPSVTSRYVRQSLRHAPRRSSNIAMSSTRTRTIPSCLVLALPANASNGRARRADFAAS